MLKNETRPAKTGIEIAVIGMFGRFPGASNIQEFWHNLKSGIESISFVADNELEEKGIGHELRNNPNYVRSRGGVLEGKEYFDASFFGYIPREAELMDCQIRLFHECAWNALEDAGYNPESYNGLIGLYAGASSNFYWEALTILSGKSFEFGEFNAEQLRDKDFLSSRVSYKLNLRGPSLTINTACSTSLVTIHLACQAILDGECDLALAGGVSTKTIDENGYIFQEGMILSPDGHCRAFDADAGGTVGGEGVGVVVLKSLEEALSDGDNINSVIKGSAINNDGVEKSGYAAPSSEGQAEVIKMALRVAEVEPETISYIETHGTGTPLGDPIEIEGLKLAFNTDKKGFCGIGSVKTNIGHLDAAAGVASFIKVVLALKNREMPPILHYKQANPNIDFDNSPFYVNTVNRGWKTGSNLLRAGISSFGIGGTNAHVILEETPTICTEPSHSRDYQLILLSASTEYALEKLTANLREYFKANEKLNFSDAAFTLKVGRKTFEHRKMLACRNSGEAIKALSNDISGEIEIFCSRTSDIPVFFMFPGQGAQYMDMGLELYQKERVFRNEMDRCFDILKSITGIDLINSLYPHRDESGSCDQMYNERLKQTEIAQPALFIFEYALARLLMKWGVHPLAMVGHSIGEYTAACLSGVLPLEEALNMVALRGKLMQRLSSGAMLGVALPEDKLEPFLNEKISLAAVNSPSNCVVSGSHEEIASLTVQMREKAIETRLLHTSHAFHSCLMEPIMATFEKEISKVKFNRPEVPYISNVSGRWITFGEASSPNYWSSHLRKTVRFYDGLSELLKEKELALLEVGPGKSLSTFVRQHPEKKASHHVLNLIRHPHDEASDQYYLLNKIGKMWLYGSKIDWNGFYADEDRRRIPLPIYPFEGQRYWIAEDLYKNSFEKLLDKTFLGKKSNISDWFYVPTWKRVQLPFYKNGHPGNFSNCLVFLNDNNLGNKLVENLRSAGYRVITVEVGETFAKEKNNSYRINPENSSDYDSLFITLDKLKSMPNSIVHLWGVDPFNQKGLDVQRFNKIQERGFYSLLRIAQAIEKLSFTDNIRISVVSNNLHNVTGDEELCPAKATMIGPLKVIPQEYPYITCKSIDILWPIPDTLKIHEFVDLLRVEIEDEFSETIVAYRGKHRWVQFFETIKLRQPERKISKLKEKGCYWIVGGLGKIGMMLAEFLANSVSAKLFISSHSYFPSQEEWGNWLESHGRDDDISQNIMKLREFEKAGAEILIYRADVSNKIQMREALERAEKKFEKINGIIYCAANTRDNLRAVCDESKKTSIEQFKTKVYGLLVLDDILADKELDFCVLMSSISSILGGLGFVSYSSANLFMDAFCHQSNGAGYRNWLSVNWDGWKFVKSTGKVKIGASLEELSITPAEGLDVFQYIFLLDGINQIIVSTGDLQVRLDQWIKLEDLKREDEPEQKENVVLQARPNLTKAYSEPRNKSENTLSAMWSKFFGFKDIGIDDDFFELGGDSMKAMTIVANIHKSLNVKITLPEFFRAPTIRGVSQLLRNSSEFRYYSIVPTEKREYYSLSSVQRRLYFLQQLNMDNTTYNMPNVLGLKEGIDGEKLAAIFEQLIARHESLRTSFSILNGQPSQRVHDNVKFNIQYIEFKNELQSSELNHRSRTGYIDQAIGDFVQPFDLAQPPLLRVGLVKALGKKDILLIDMHHIVSDAVSHDVLVQDFISLYEGGVLLPLRLQYKDYSHWQNCKKYRELIGSQEQYWLNQFSDEVPILNLPTDIPRFAVQRFEGSSIEFFISGGVTERLRQITREINATLYMVLFSIFYILIAKLSRQEDIVIGTPIAARPHVDLEKIVGMFVNTLAVRNYPSADKNYVEFLKEVKDRTLEAFENQEYPFEELVEKIVANRDTSRNPVFDVMFALLGRDTLRSSETNMKERSYSYKSSKSKFDLTLNGVEEQDGLFFTFEYCTKLFRKETIDRYVRYYEEAINSIINGDINCKIFEIEIISDQEKELILNEFNNTKTVYPREKTIVELIEPWVETLPDHIAVVYEDKRLTYRGLNERANQLGRIIIERGVKPGVIVGIMVVHSIEMIIGVLSVLKSGGAYLPLDTGYPDERVKFMVEDSGCELLLSQTYLTERLSKIIEVMDMKCDALAEEDTNNLGNVNNSRDLAYTVYTSGSTGKPNGVAVEHEALVNLCSWHNRYYSVTSNDRATKYAGFGFDASVWEIFPYLMVGATLYIINEEIKFDLFKLNKYFENNQITISFLPTQIGEQFIKFANKSLKRLLVGGDKLHSFKKKPFEIHNNYGPTENTVVATACPVGDDLDNIPIGFPIDNNRIYILDSASRRLQSIGVPGELCIAGDSLARGYLNKPELMEEKFVSNLAVEKERLYRTGDLARWLDDGRLQFLGRIDNQVKIRGNRIELAEIEHYLLKHEHILEAVVLIKEDKSKEKHLYAYIVSEKELIAQDLREYLSLDLPDYMMPSYFIQLDKIPLTPNGKVDKSLLERHYSRLSVKKEILPPKTREEKMVAEIWKKVLSMEEIGVNVNFFDIGGTSLKIIHLLDLLSQSFDVDVPMMSIFQYPTIRAFVGFLNHQETIVRNRSKELSRGKQDRRRLLKQRRKVKDE